MLVLSWNLFHGRALPPVNRSLYDAFVGRLGDWRWDVALLQEVPPWWPRRLAVDLGVQQCSARTSRNSLLPLRRALAERRPELLKSNGGGCNAILARGEIVEHRAQRLRRWPERRVAQLARLRDGTRVVNVHASTRPARAAQELERLWALALAWTGEDRLVLGGDLNLRTPKAPAPAPTGPARPASTAAHSTATTSSPPPDRSAAAPPIVHAAASGVDHIFARGFAAVSVEAAAQPRRTVTIDGASVELSDHAPLLAELRPQPG